MMLHPWAGFVIMPIFALANAGVAISGADIGQSVSVAIFTGLAFGKPIGILTFSWLAARFGFAIQASLNLPFLAAGALLTGIDFTISVFIAGLAYPPRHARRRQDRNSRREIGRAAWRERVCQYG